MLIFFKCLSILANLKLLTCLYFVTFKLAELSARDLWEKKTSWKKKRSSSRRKGSRTRAAENSLLLFLLSEEQVPISFSARRERNSEENYKTITRKKQI